MTPIVIGDKGRVVLPVAVRTAAGVDVGDELIVRSPAPGQILLETRSVVITRLRSRFTGSGGTQDLHDARARDREMDNRRSRRTSPAFESAGFEAEIRRAEEILAALDAPPARRAKAS